MTELVFGTLPGLLQGVVLMAVAPLLLGLLNFCAALCQGRQRLPTTILQPYRDLFRLYRQRSVRAQTGSWLFAAAPVVQFVAYGALLFAAPWVLGPPLIRLDLLTVLYLLALARFTFSLAGLDAAAPFGALGSSREMFLHLQTEVSMALFIAAIALNRRILDLATLSAAQAGLGLKLWFQPDLVLLVVALAAIILYEAGRIPIDNPATELELTMAHEAIAGEYAGRDLALIRWANAMKLAFLLVLFVDLFPVSAGAVDGLWWRGIAGLFQLAELLLLVVLLALWEVTRPKLRLRKVYGPALVSALFSLTAILYTLALGARG